ncbi:ABC transporter permease [Paenibacillus sp. MER 99-2]|uniref:ABC transporter permease n=2 Tax=unclassified Paenibacillus TaxID=185978 RepID=UPI00203B801D|nr:ABC transporter permease [Paenibacillus sp. MER 99-2]MCM3174957.1 ABC transporter permease [Paenibacillus sp. MER 99-2]
MWTIFATSMKRKLQNPVVFVNYILLPLLLILILGNALSGVFQSEDQESKHSLIPQISTVVVNEDDGEVGKNVVAFLSSSANEEMFDIQIQTSSETAMKMLESGQVEQFIYLPSDLTLDYEAHQIGNITVYGKDNHIEKVNITDLALSAYGDGYLAMEIASASNQNIVYSHQYSNMLTASGETDRASASSSGSSISAMSYYGVTMLVLILVYGLANTMNFVQEEYSEALEDRYLVTPISKTALIMGQFLTGVTISIMQGVVIVVCAKLFFDVSYGDSIMFVLFIILAGAIFFNALGLLLGVIARRIKQVDGLVTILIPVMTFVGGGFVKLDMGELSSISINEVFQRPMFDYIQQGVIDLMPVFTALITAMGFLLISVYSLTRKVVR